MSVAPQSLTGNPDVEAAAAKPQEDGLGSRQFSSLFNSSIGQSSLTCRCSRETLLLGQLGAFGAFLLVSQACESGLAQFSPGGLSGESGVEAAPAKP